VQRQLHVVAGDASHYYIMVSASVPFTAAAAALRGRLPDDPDFDRDDARAMSARIAIPRRALRRASEGVAAVEFAVVFPVFMLLVLGIMDFGRAFWTWNTMRLAVEQAGRYAMVYNGCDTGGACGPTGTTCTILATCVQTYAATPAAGPRRVERHDHRVQVDLTSYSTMLITATYTFNFIVPGMLKLVNSSAPLFGR